MADKSIQMQRKNADGSFDRHYPLVKEVGILPDSGDIVLSRVDGQLVQVDETVGGMLRRRTTLSRTATLLSSVMTTVYASDGAVVERQWVETLNRTGGQLISVTRMVIV